MSGWVNMNYPKFGQIGTLRVLLFHTMSNDDKAYAYHPAPVRARCRAKAQWKGQEQLGVLFYSVCGASSYWISLADLKKMTHGIKTKYGTNSFQLHWRSNWFATGLSHFHSLDFVHPKAPRRTLRFSLGTWGHGTTQAVGVKHPPGCWPSDTPRFMGKVV